ncbi:hypothetical protein H5410_020186 [Solanum commersonii]|uniref:Uncharacterized protein n=1 Tax=Solanum commersonii TaxID=4109 RepID=A0A9J5Z7P7_SOLCO|nr:hypothetical protein H5410_020186 [Solanum commersonii]
MWSKSPVRSRTWSLPPRRLTEGLNGCRYLSQHRSPAMYREDRIGSSSRTSFIEEAIAPQRFPEHHSGERSKYGERQGGPRQMRNVKEKEVGNLRRRHEEEFDGFRLKKRIF